MFETFGSRLAKFLSLYPFALQVSVPSGTTVLEAAHQNQVVPTMLVERMNFYVNAARSTWRVLAKHL